MDSEKFYSICKAKSMQAWIVKWLNLLNPGNKKTASLMVRAVIRENLSPSQVILPKKYSNFLNIFDKA